MPESPLAVVGAGLVSGVGLTVAECCAAIRCGINGFRETRFIAGNGERIVGSEVPPAEPWDGTTKFVNMAAAAIGECLDMVGPGRAKHVPVLLAVAERSRPGRAERFPFMLHDVATRLGVVFHRESRLIEDGSVAGAVGLFTARQLIGSGRHQQVIVAGVDSLLTGQNLAALEHAGRLLSPTNSNGFVPGEAAGAVLLAAPQDGAPAPVLLRGLGFSREPAPRGSGKPLRADGLVQAICAAVAEAGLALHDCDCRISDVNGEQYRFKEAALAVTRVLRERKAMFSLWHLADTIAEVGAATVPTMLAVLFQAANKDYLPGRTFLGHVSGDGDKRTAFVATAANEQSLALDIRAEAAFRLKRRSSG
jgi:3-oxoacyl-[acyl-carrier-protein] synthase-1